MSSITLTRLRKKSGLSCADNYFQRDRFVIQNISGGFKADLFNQSRSFEGLCFGEMVFTDIPLSIMPDLMISEGLITAINYININKLKPSLSPLPHKLRDL